jgi:hypothetical protein
MDQVTPGKPGDRGRRSRRGGDAGGHRTGECAGPLLALVELLKVHGVVLARQHRWDEAERAFEKAVSVARGLYATRTLRRGLYEWGLRLK